MAAEPPVRSAGPSAAELLRKVSRNVRADNLLDRAAALTYYAMLSLFPGLLVLVSLLGLVGISTTDRLQEALTVPGPVGEVINGAVDNVQESRTTAGAVAVFGLLGAFWSASSYVAAFMRAAQAIHRVAESRPFWKVLPLRIGLTTAVGVMLVFSVLILVLTGELAALVGEGLGISGTVVRAWEVAKWPVLLLLASLIFETLYWASSPHTRRRFRLVSPGGLLAVLTWVLVSAGFALYVAHFGSYNRTYGSLAGVVIFLVWLWLANLAILLGAEVDAELTRGRTTTDGHPEAGESRGPNRERGQS